MSRATHPGQVEITFRYSRHVGPMHIHGGVTLQVDGLKPYGFVSYARWPPTDNYELAVREVIERVLQERQGHLTSTLVTLVAIEWDEVASSEFGFRKAAAASAHAAFEV